MQNIVWLKAAKLTAIDFFKNTSLTGFKLLFYLDKSNVLQLLWIPCLLTSAFAAIYITGHCVLFFQMNPTVTNINTFHQPASEVPFPAVSICSVNKISHLALRKYVNEIWTSRLSPPGVDEETLLKKLHLFGGFYDSSGFDIDDAYELQSFLDGLDPVSPGFYNVTEVLGMLAPKCEYVLRKCSWQGTTYPCDELFSIQATPEGFCCVFNYMRPEKEKKRISVKYLESVGDDRGLTVLLNTSADDYFFSKRSTLGFVIQIFNGFVYPDILTGKLSEFPVSPNVEVMSSIELNSLISEDRVRIYNIGQRNCYFADELPAEYGAHYSQQECFLKCKLKSILSLCSCIPFYTPDDLIDGTKPVMYCTLAHLECLSRYKPRWTTYRPLKNIAGLEQEKEDGLHCPKCLPLCVSHEYEYRLDTAVFPDYVQVALDEFLTNETNLKETSLLRIFYDVPFATQYIKRTVYSGYGLFGNVGGILGLTIGCSVVCVIEIFYFATIKFHKNLKKLRLVELMAN